MSDSGFKEKSLELQGRHLVHEPSTGIARAQRNSRKSPKESLSLSSLSVLAQGDRLLNSDEPHVGSAALNNRNLPELYTLARSALCVAARCKALVANANMVDYSSNISPLAW
jgi:hypothetical protein